MNNNLTIGGVDVTTKLVRLEILDEYCNPGRRASILLDSDITVKTWDNVVLVVDGDRVFTGNVQRIERENPPGGVHVTATDDIRRLREYFIAEDYTSQGEGAKYWIGKFAGDAGCSVEFLEDYDPQTLSGMTFGRMFAWDAIDELLLFCGWDIWCDEYNQMKVGRRMRDKSPTIDIKSGQNLVKFDRLQDSEPCRNKALVYTIVGGISAGGKYGWEIDDNDIRTMVVSEQFYFDEPANAIVLADRMLSAAGPVHDTKICETTGTTEIKVGKRARYDNGVGDAGVDDITTSNIRLNGNSGDWSVYVKLGERCPKVGAGGAVATDGRDVIVATLESGVWRCFDIWADEPIWHPLNNGLEKAYPEFDIPENGGFKCNWFIRDPYNPNHHAYLLTKYGIYETHSLIPGQEYWLPKLPNKLAGGVIVKLKSTIARQGTFFFVILWKNVGPFGVGDIAFTGQTRDNFAMFEVRKMYHCDMWESFSCVPMSAGIGIGDSNQYYGNLTAITSWHEKSAYITDRNHGGLAAWHRCDWGFSTSGVASSPASNAVPGVWAHGLVKTDGKDVYATSITSKINGKNHVDRFLLHSAVLDNHPAAWLDSPSIHIPYKQRYISVPQRENRIPGGWPVPSIIYIQSVFKGLTQGGEWLTRPHKVDLLHGGFDIYPPWGEYNNHPLQGALGTYTQDPNKVYLFRDTKPADFAISNDGAKSWEQKSSVPVRCGCFSGFPTNSGKIYAGRDPKVDASAPPVLVNNHCDTNDDALLYVSWDRGDTWDDVTGDLWEKTKQLGFRQCPYWGYDLGTAGLVTISPRYS